MQTATPNSRQLPKTPGNLKEIKEPIKDELSYFEKKFKEEMKNDVPLLDKVSNYILKRKGKQMRPMFVLLSAALYGDITHKTYTGAALIELLHTATLVHDDVVDDSFERRGFFSINALWKNKVAVLVGDYLLSRGLLMSIDHDSTDLLRITSNAVKSMSEGEMLQIEKARRLDIQEDVYFDIISKKTASLIASACACGACSTGADQQQINDMWAFGQKIGIAFQIKDDLLDYGNGDIGKPKGTDIKEKKMTLPLIYALNHADKQTKRSIIHTVKNNNNDKEKVKEVIDYVLQSGGIEYSREKMVAYRQAALNYLAGWPESSIRDSLEQLIMYTTERKK